MLNKCTNKELMSSSHNACRELIGCHSRIEDKFQTQFSHMRTGVHEAELELGLTERQNQ